jgi:predicted RNA-binding protein
MKITLEYSIRLNPRLNPDLFMPDPKIVLKKINESPVKDWLKFIANEYRMQRVENLIFIPCSFYKPYDPPHDEFYRRINELKKKIRDSKFITVSVPLGLEPEEYWSFQWRGYNLIYDCPFFPWIENYGYKWDEKVVQKVLQKLEKVVDGFFERNIEQYRRSIAFLVPSSIELRFIRKYVDHIILNDDSDIEVSYDNNTSEVYCRPEIWRVFEVFLKYRGIIT